MPPAFPMMPIMMLELGLYGLTISMIYSNFSKNPYSCLLISMLIGRIGAGIMVFILANLFSANLPSPIIFIKGAIATGLPGILIQLIFIPLILIPMKKLNIPLFQGDQ